MKNKISILGVSIILIAIVYFGLSQFYQKEKVVQEQQKINQLQHLVMRSNAPSFGPKDAKVTLVEFLDPECESCRAFYPFTKKLLQQFPNDLRLVIRYMPLHKNSKKAIRILEASRLQNKYKETMDIFFEKQPQWGDHHHPRPELLWTYLPEIGLDVEKVKRDILSPQIDHWIQKDIEDAKKLGVRRTPTFFINGQPLAEFGFQELEQAIINAVNSK